MKFIHLSDLHIGKRVNDFSMLEDQEYILQKILYIIEEQQPDGVIIAGDVYDKAVPSAEAVQVFDEFLTQLSAKNLCVYIISGNHDSPERLSFGARLFSQNRIFVSPVFQGEVQPIEMTDSYGTVHLYLLPFIKPPQVRRLMKNREEIDEEETGEKSSVSEKEIRTYEDAVRVVVEGMNVDISDRNILIAHQFITGAATSDSEELSAGGMDNVSVSLFDAFDYVALGHIHRPQKIGRETVRYAGTPLKYSFSEANHKKSVTVVELKEKGEIEIDTIPLIPKRDLREIKGKYEDIVEKKNYEGTNTRDYMHITLTDEEDILDAIGKLRAIYPNIMKLDYDNARTRSGQQPSESTAVDQKKPIELFDEFYEKQNNRNLSEQQQDYLLNLMEQIWGGERR
ncbi:MAG: exonuclease SbcCD subunit D [Hespellia sp.]|nr:exonuclease SbcCD subunit D [Hespellia sp.]